MSLNELKPICCNANQFERSRTFFIISNEWYTVSMLLVLEQGISFQEMVAFLNLLLLRGSCEIFEAHGRFFHIGDVSESKFSLRFLILETNKIK